MDNFSILVDKLIMESIVGVGPMVAVSILFGTQESQSIFRDKRKRYIEEPRSSSESRRRMVSRMKDRDRDHSSVGWVRGCNDVSTHHSIIIIYFIPRLWKSQNTYGLTSTCHTIYSKKTHTAYSWNCPLRLFRGGWLPKGRQPEFRDGKFRGIMHNENYVAIGRSVGKLSHCRG